MIEGVESVQEVRDISKTMDREVFGYDVILNSDHVEEILRNQMDDLAYNLDDDEEGQEALFEQAEYISDAIVDGLKDFIESRYGVDDFESAYNVYKADLDGGIGVTLTLSFGKIKHGKLYQLASKVDHKGSNFN
jgi:hypothetical protein